MDRSFWLVVLITTAACSEATSRGTAVTRVDEDAGVAVIDASSATDRQDAQADGAALSPDAVTPDGSARAEDGSAQADALPDEAVVLRTICMGTCSGPFARATAWKDAAGATSLYVYDGDINRCSHPPRIYYDRFGREVGRVGSGPVPQGQTAPGPALHMRLTAGLTEGKLHLCQ